MNTKIQQVTRSWSPPFVCIAMVSALLSNAKPASAVSIDVTLEPAGPVAVGAVVTVHLSISGWDPSDGQVDAIAFNVDFDENVFEFVTGSGTVVDDGTEFLALPPQGAGYMLFDATTEAAVAFGRFGFGVMDNGDGTAGSEGPDGLLGSFQLRAIAESDGSSITPTSNDPNQIFGDPGFLGITPTGGVTLISATVSTFVGVTYPTWRAGFAFSPPEDGEPGENPDSGVAVNLIEYAFDMNPLVADLDRLPEFIIVDDGGTDYAALRYLRPTGTQTRTDLDYVAQRSADGSNWVTSGLVESLGPGPGNSETVTVRSATPLGTPGEEILRIRLLLKSE